MEEDTLMDKIPKNILLKKIKNLKKNTKKLLNLNESI